MTIVNTQQWLVWLEDETELQCTEGTVTIDDSWAPFVQGTLTFPTPADLDPIDPRAVHRISASLRQRFGTYSLTVDLDAFFGPVGITSDLDMFGGGVTSDLDALLDEEFNADFIEGTALELAGMYVRSRQVNSDGTTTITFASAEAALDDLIFEHQYFFVGGYTPFTTLEQLLEFLVTTNTDYPIEYVRGSANYTLPADPIGGSGTPVAVESIGTTLWAMLDAYVKAANLRLYGALDGTLRLSQPEQPLEGTVDLGARATRISDKIDRDASDWADAVLVKYDENPLSLGNQLYIDHDPRPWTKKILVPVPVPSPIDGINNPNPSVPQTLHGRRVSRVRSVEVTGINNFAALPNRAITLDVPGMPGLPQLTGIVDAVTFNRTTGEMSATTRSLQEI